MFLRNRVIRRRDLTLRDGFKEDIDMTREVPAFKTLPLDECPDGATDATDVLLFGDSDGSAPDVLSWTIFKVFIFSATEVLLFGDFADGTTDATDVLLVGDSDGTAPDVSSWMIFKVLVFSLGFECFLL